MRVQFEDICEGDVDRSIVMMDEIAALLKSNGVDTCGGTMCASMDRIILTCFSFDSHATQTFYLSDGVFGVAKVFKEFLMKYNYLREYA